MILKLARALRSTTSALALVTLLHSNSTAAPVQGSHVTTLAGSGKAGMSDGPAAAATFLFPTAIARGNDGTLYIADEAAQRIRALSPVGMVTTLAGSGALAKGGLSVEGGYREGPALQAQFNRPDALAVAPDGALLIADERNACIRKLAAGVVSQAVGRCAAAGSADGDAQDARLQDPRAMVFDRNHNLYIADFGVGVRRVEPNGRVTTLAAKSTGDKRFWGIAIGGEPDDPTLVASTPQNLVVWHLAAGTDEVIGTTAAEGNRNFGIAGQLAGLSRREFLFTDIRSSVIRYVRLAAPPFATTTFTRTIAGGAAERVIDNAGFSDGSLSEARFYDPFGIVVHNGSAIVADSGNRRIRLVALPHFRLSESGFADRAPYDDQHYQIVYLGASWAYWDSLGDDSICGQLEERLERARRFSKPVRCHPVRIDAASFPQMASYISTYLQMHYDLLVINMNLAEAYSIFPNSAPPSTEAGAAALKEHVAKLMTQLKAGRTKLLFIWAYDPEDVSDSENLMERQDNPGRRYFPSSLRDNHDKGTVLMMNAVRPLGVFQCDTYDDFQRYERNQTIPPLFGSDDSHMTPRGSTLMAELLARYIESERGL